MVAGVSTQAQFRRAVKEAGRYLDELALTGDERARGIMHHWPDARIDQAFPDECAHEHKVRVPGYLLEVCPGCRKVFPMETM